MSEKSKKTRQERFHFFGKLLITLTISLSNQAFGLELEDAVTWRALLMSSSGIKTGADSEIERAIIEAGTNALEVSPASKRNELLRKIVVLHGKAKSIRTAADFQELVTDPVAITISMPLLLPKYRMLLPDGKILWEQTELDRRTIQVNSEAILPSTLNGSSSNKVPLNIRRQYLDVFTAIYGNEGLIAAADLNALGKKGIDASSNPITALQQRILQAASGSNQLTVSTNDLVVIEKLAINGFKETFASNEFVESLKTAFEKKLAFPSEQMNILRLEINKAEQINALLSIAGQLTQDPQTRTMIGNALMVTQGVDQILHSGAAIAAAGFTTGGIGSVLALAGGLDSLFGGASSKDAASGQILGAIADVQKSIDALIDLNRRGFEKTWNKLDTLDTKLNSLNSKVDLVLSQLQQLNAKADKLQDQGQIIRDELAQLSSSIAGIDGTLDRIEQRMVNEFYDATRNPCMRYKADKVQILPGNAIASQCYATFMKRIEDSTKPPYQIETSSKMSESPRLENIAEFRTPLTDPPNDLIDRYLSSFSSSYHSTPQIEAKSSLLPLPNPTTLLTTVSTYLAFAGDFPEVFWHSDKRSDLKSMIEKIEHFKAGYKALFGDRPEERKKILSNLVDERSIALDRLIDAYKELDDRAIREILVLVHRQPSQQRLLSDESITVCSKDVLDYMEYYKFGNTANIGSISIPDNLWKVTGNIGDLAIPAVYTVGPGYRQKFKIIEPDGSVVTSKGFNGGSRELISRLRLCFSAITPSQQVLINHHIFPPRNFVIRYGVNIGYEEIAGKVWWRNEPGVSFNYNDVPKDPPPGLLLYMDRTPRVKESLLNAISSELKRSHVLDKATSLMLREARNNFELAKVNFVSRYIRENAEVGTPPIRISVLREQLENANLRLKFFLRVVAPSAYAKPGWIRKFMVGMPEKGRLIDKTVIQSWLNCTAKIDANTFQRDSTHSWDLRYCAEPWKSSDATRFRSDMRMETSILWLSLNELALDEEPYLPAITLLESKLKSIQLEAARRFGPEAH